MSQLRLTVINNIYLTLESTDFSLRDFKVELEDPSTFVHISFLPFPEYSFEISEKDFARYSALDYLNKENMNPDVRLITSESPGEFKVSSIHKHRNIDECIERIPAWCSNIVQELSVALPENNDLDQFEIDMEEKLNAFTGDDKQPFTNKEISELSEKLDKFASKFTELEKANEITEKELAEIQKDLDKMKTNLSQFPKSVWYKTSAHKMLDTMKKVASSKEGKSLLFLSAKKLFGLE